MFNDRNVTGDFVLKSKSKGAEESFKVHLFVLVARSAYFRGLIESPMMESQKMESALLDAPPNITRST